MALLAGKDSLKTWLGAAVLAHLLLLPCWQVNITARSPASLLAPREAALAYLPSMALLTLAATLLCWAPLAQGAFPATRAKALLILLSLALLSGYSALGFQIRFQYLGWFLLGWSVAIVILTAVSVLRPALSALWPLIPFLWGTAILSLPPPSVKPLRRRAVPPGGAWVWVVLCDELDDRLLTEEMAAAPEAFPGLWGLRRQAVRFSDATTASTNTIQAVCTMLAGRELKDVEIGQGPGLTLVRPGGGRERFDPGDTLFADIRSVGGTVATVGWYWPYPRLLSGVQDGWRWIPSSLFRSGFDPPPTFSGRLKDHLRVLSGWRTGTNLRWASLTPAQRFESQACDRVRFAEEMKAYLREGPAGFTWIHAPFPHPPSVRFEGSYRETLRYLDGFVGALRTDLEAQGIWDDACVVLLSDHPLRPFWDWEKGLLDNVRNNGAESRFPVPVWIKLPGNHGPFEIRSPFRTEDLRTLLLALAKGEQRSPAQVAAWAAARASRTEVKP